jgi:hypothetical protein
MLSWLRRLLGMTAPRSAGHGVAFNDADLRVSEPDGKEQGMRWQDLGHVAIHTNDQGPFDVDLHWVLTSRDGRQTLSVPLGASGEQELLAELQRRLPGFDNDAVVRAMSSTDNASFDVWSWTPITG